MSFQENKSQDSKRFPKNTSRGDFIFNRMAFLCALLIVFVFFVLYAPQSIVFFYHAVPVIAALLLVLSLVFFWIHRKAGSKDTERLFSLSFLSRTALVSALLVSLTFAVREQASLVLVAFAVVGLVFVRYNYSHDFFWLSAAFFAGILLAVLPRILVIFPGNNINYILSVASAVLSVAVAAAFCGVSCAALSGTNPGLSSRFFNVGYVRRYPLFLLPAVSVCCTAIRFFIPKFFSYALIAAVILYFVFLVIYAFDSAK
ncbi:MAG: hypothetical protein ACI4WZ_08040 [Eubacteriales bacterium]